MNLDLARQVAIVAGDLEAKGYSYAGVIRQAARALAAEPQSIDDGCRRCGAPLPSKGRGRPRIWCDDQCRRGKARK